MGKTFSTGLLTNGLWQDASNNIGIGGSPSGSYKLEVTGTGNFTGALTGGSTAAFVGNVTAGDSSGGQVFRTANAGTSSVGIRLTNTGGNSFIGLSNSGGTGYLSGSAYALNIQTEGARDLQLGTNNATRMVITSAGNVGIGNSNPQKKLDISGDAFAGIGIYDGTNTGVLQWHSSDGFRLVTSTAKPIVIFTNDTERMRITSAGRVFIGVTSDPAGGALAVASNGVVVQSGGNYRQMYQSGNTMYWFNGSNEAYLSSAGVWTNASDISIKKDINDIKYGLNEVMKLKPKCYKMINDDLEQIGFIAQDIEEVLPELVSTSDRGMKGLSYGNLTAVLTKAIQEMNQQNQDLKSRLDKAGL